MKHMDTYIIWLGTGFCFYSQWIESTIALRHLDVVDLKWHKVTVRFISHVREPPEIR
jgi:hypothetical protein